VPFSAASVIAWRTREFRSSTTSSKTFLLAREVEVEGALADAGRLGDLHDRGVVVAELGEDPLGRLQQLLAGALAAGGQLLHRHELQQLGLDDLVERVPGSDSTKRTPRGTL
jgi:hypothetical protein